MLKICYAEKSWLDFFDWIFWHSVILRQNYLYKDSVDREVLYLPPHIALLKVNYSQFITN